MAKRKGVNGEPANQEKKSTDRKKTCPGCGARLAFPIRRCPQCGHLFGKGAQVKAPAAVKKGGTDPVSILLAANDFAAHVGGLDEAIALLEALRKIKG